MGGKKLESMKLITAVREQADAVEEIAGFADDRDCNQFLRDTRDAAFRLEVAEGIIQEHALSTLYRENLREFKDMESALRAVDRERTS